MHRLDHALGHLPAGERRPVRGPRGRPGEPAPLAAEPPAPRVRGDARRDPGRRRPARRGDRGPSGLDHRRAVLDPAHGLRLIDRQNLDGLFRTFDFASPDASTPARHTTVVPQQALFLMNSPFVAEQARHLADRAARDAGPDPDRQVAALYRLALARPPEAREADLARRFLDARGTPDPAGPSPARRSSPRSCCSPTNSCSSIDREDESHAAPPADADRCRDDPPRAAPPLGDGASGRWPSGPCWPSRAAWPAAATGSTTTPAGGTPAAVRAQGQAGHPPVHERRARRRSTPSTPSPSSTKYARQAAPARTCRPSARPAPRSARRSSSRSTARAGSRSASSSPRRPSTPTTSASSARCTPTCRTTSRR